MTNDLHLASGRLGRLDLNIREEPIPLHHFWCRVAFQAYEQFNAKPHRHSFFELHLCLSGSCRMEAFGSMHTLTPQSFLLLPPQELHTIHSQSPDFTKFVWGFSVEEEMIAIELLQGASRNAPQSVSDEFIHGLHVMLQNSDGSAFGYHQVILGELYHLFLQLVRILSPTLPTVPFPKNRSTQLLEIQKYILDNLSAGLTVQDIAAQFHLSRKQLVHLCQAECGMTPHRLKQGLQSQKIRQYLSDTDLSLDEIASLCGFSDKYTMTKFFTKSEGLPPARYRRAVHS